MKVLVANRGEIARRVIKTLKKKGIKAVAVYSDADKNSLFVEEADEAFRIGEPHPLKSYLNADAIIEVAKKAKVDGIHPGYGFLSERAFFVRKCEEAGIIFIGPSAESMEMLGDKVSAREIAKKVGVPIPPGSDVLNSPDEALEWAKKLGFPVLFKASAGGGGIGMKKVERGEDLKNSFEEAKRRAKSAFGDDRVYIEKYLHSPHHIEIQVLGDGKGNITTFWERECSVQRRHQKVIEESPSTFVDDGLREEIRDAARKIMSYVKYKNAGTCEFVVDGDKNFYFLEVNTRLQVEHPVTEGITGVDLVEEQLNIAFEGKLLYESKVSYSGWAIEARIYAEDPERFLPSPGKITKYSEPAKNHFEWVEDIRVDSGFREGDEITPFYDPMIAKLIVRGKTRSEAIERMLYALQRYEIQGIKTNIPFHIRALSSDLFRKGGYDTHFIEKLNSLNNE